MTAPSVPNSKASRVTTGSFPLIPQCLKLFSKVSDEKLNARVTVLIGLCDDNENRAFSIVPSALVLALALLQLMYF